MFTPKQVPRYAPVMADEAAATVARWSQLDGPADVHPEMGRLTLRVVNRVLFGGDVDAAERVVGPAFPLLSEHVFRRMHLPVWSPWSWPTPGNRRARRARAELFAAVEAIVEQRRRAPLPDHDFVSRLVAARDPETGQSMDVTQIRDEVLVFLRLQSLLRPADVVRLDGCGHFTPLDCPDRLLVALLGWSTGRR